MEGAVEQELIRKCRAGDSRFYEPLVRAYESAAFRLALGMLGDSDDAGDAVQDSFVRAYEKLDRFDDSRPFAPWLLQIVRNRCRDMLRRRRPRFDLSVLDNAGIGARRNVDRTERRREARELVWSALERVSDEHREILVLKELQGLRYAEIAEVLGIPEGTVASRLYHARRALRTALVEMGAEYP